MNDNIIIVLAAYAVAYIFYSKNIDFIRRGRFDEQKLHIRHMTVGKVAKQTKAL